MSTRSVASVYCFEAHLYVKTWASSTPPPCRPHASRAPRSPRTPPAPHPTHAPQAKKKGPKITKKGPKIILHPNLHSSRDCVYLNSLFCRILVCSHTEGIFSERRPQPSKAPDNAHAQLTVAGQRCGRRHFLDDTGSKPRCFRQCRRLCTVCWRCGNGN